MPRLGRPLPFWDLFKFFGFDAIDAWAKSRVADSPQAAERLLKIMLDSDEIQPDSISYGCVLEAWAQTGTEESLSKVKQIFDHMQSLYDDGKQIKPTIRNLNAIVFAHARIVSHFATSKGNHSAKAMKYATAAQDLLDEMTEKFHETGDFDFAPDVTTYTSVIDAFARCGSYEATKQAEQLLDRLKHLYDKTKKPQLRPKLLP